MLALASTLLVFFGLADLIAVIQVWDHRARTSLMPKSVAAWLVVYGGAAVMSALLLEHISIQSTIIVAVIILLLLTVRKHFKGFHHPGFLSISTAILSGMAALFWVFCFAATVNVGDLAKFSSWLLAAALTVATPVYLVNDYLTKEVLCRDGWPRRQYRFDHCLRSEPKISVHVPCYAEPPEVVNATLDAIARQMYTNFEVIVVDNNTKDEKLWRPVERHCKNLGDRFKFFHVDPLSGAKAGALNFALRQTSDQTDIVAIVDADYQADTEFLRTLVKYFSDDRLAFVQTRHDYREWKHNGYLRGCYGEYRSMYASYMISRNERNAALTTGTMCLIRRNALESVGGWAEWCSTEDSELAIRIHAAGFYGIYLGETHGRGLMPEDFAGYKRQRFRWIHGPTQEFRRHWRLFLPKKWAMASHLTVPQKVLFAYHGIRDLVASITGILMFIGIVILALDLAWHPITTPVPMVVCAAWLANITMARITTIGMLHYVAGFSWGETFRATVSDMALAGVVRLAGFSGWLVTKSRFRRTNKFHLSSNRAKAALSGLWEGLLSMATILVALLAVLRSPGDSVILTLVFILFSRALSWLTAPLLSIYGDRCVRRASLSSDERSRPTSGANAPMRDETRSENM